MLRLLGRTSSLNVRKVLWTLGELGLAYEREDWGMGFASVDRPEFRALNPNGLIPGDIGPATSVAMHKGACYQARG